MKKYEIKSAFGDAPQSFRDQVNQMIDELEDKPMKKHYKITTLLVAALVVALAGTAAVAAFEGHVKELYKNPEQNLSNDAVLPGIQALNERYEGNSVRCTVQEALYDGEGGTYALSWELINLNDEDKLYVVCDSTRFDGELGQWRSINNVSEFFLPEGATVATCLGELPDNRSNHCEISLTVLRAIGPYEQEGGGWIHVDEYADTDRSYSDALVAQGSFEIADRFTLSFDMDTEKLGSTAKRLVGENDYRFDGYELNVTFGEITATKAHIIVEYISDTEIVNGGKGIGPNYDINFALPDGDIWWTGNSGGDLGDPEQLPDGRWKCVYDYEAVELFTQPDELLMSLNTYPMKDGDFDLDNPTERATVTLKFE